MIYLDNAATTKSFNEVIDIYNKYVNESFFNPSSLYSNKLANLEEQIKDNILNKLNIKNRKIIFLSSATEANNLAVLGYIAKKGLTSGHLITTEVEHSSLLNVFKYLESKGFEVTYLKLNKEHQINIEEFKKSLKSDTFFVSIMSVNNETGDIIDLNKVYELTKSKGIILHSDCAQSFLKLDNRHLQYNDMFTISSHKIHGLKSIAALIVNEKTLPNPIIFGGNQEYGIRSSTVDIPLIASFYKAIELNLNNFNQNNLILKDLYEYALKKINERDYMILNSNPHISSYYIINFSFISPYKAAIVVEYLKTKQIYVSTTSACNSKKEPESYVIKSLYNDDYRAHNSIRLSFDQFNTKEEIDITFNEIDKCIKEVLWKI